MEMALLETALLGFGNFVGIARRFTSEVVSI